jgi:hypothetical protein
MKSTRVEAMRRHHSIFALRGGGFTYKEIGIMVGLSMRGVLYHAYEHCACYENGLADKEVEFIQKGVSELLDKLAIQGQATK